MSAKHPQNASTVMSLTTCTTLCFCACCHKTKVVPLTMRVEADPTRVIDEPNRLWTEEEMRKLPKDQLAAALWGGYVHEPTQQWIELRDGGHYTNHSNTPNCEAGYSADPFDDEQFSIEDIKAGDEIFEDYGCVDSRRWEHDSACSTVAHRLRFSAHSLHDALPCSLCVHTISVIAQPSC